VQGCVGERIVGEGHSVPSAKRSAHELLDEIALIWATRNDIVTSGAVIRGGTNEVFVGHVKGQRGGSIAVDSQVTPGSGAGVVEEWEEIARKTGDFTASACTTVAPGSLVFAIARARAVFTARTRSATMPAGAAMFIAVIQHDAAGSAERFVFGARIDAGACSAHHPFGTSLVAASAVSRVAVEIYAEDPTASIANLPVGVRSRLLDVVAKASEFVRTQLLVDGHPITAKRIVFGDLEVED
jgi:hypothetical protein